MLVRQTGGGKFNPLQIMYQLTETLLLIPRLLGKPQEGLFTI